MDLRVGAELRECGAAGLVAGFGNLPEGETVYAEEPKAPKAVQGEVLQGSSPTPVPPMSPPSDQPQSDLGSLIPDELWAAVTGEDSSADQQS